MSTDEKENPYPASPAQSRLDRVFEHWGGKLIITFSFLHLSHDIVIGLLVALLPFIREDLGLDYFQSGLLVSVTPIIAGLFQFVGGWLCDRMSLRKALTLGLFGVGLCSVSITFTSSYYALLAILIAMGMLAGFYHPATASAITNIYEEGRRGKAMAIHNIGGRIGFGLSPLLGALIASYLNWRYAYAIIGLPALVAAILVFTRLILSTDSKTSVSSATPPVVKSEPGELLRVFKSVGVIMAFSIAITLFFGPIFSFIPLLLVDVYHFSPAASSTLITVIRIGGMVGSLLGGWLSDKWGRLRILFIAMILQGPAVLLLTQFPFGVTAILSCILFGLLMSMREITMQTYLMDNSPPRLRATVFGIYFGFGQEGSSIVQPFAGNFMDTWGISKVYSYISWIITGLSALTLVFAITTTRKQKNAKDIPQIP